MARLRVMVVEDSLTMRERLLEVLRGDPEIEVVGQAVDGRQAIELCQQLRPDVMTLDMVLPVMSGLATAEYVMAYCPTPILVVSSSFNRGAIFKTFEALSAGAVDVLEKPRADELDEEWNARLLRTLKMVARIKVISHVRARLDRPKLDEPAPATVQTSGARGHSLVAIGASTGGPAAVCELLRALPANFPLPILLVIHVGKVFGDGLCDWLRGESPIPVAHARDGEPLPAKGTSRVVLAPPDLHLTVQGGLIRLTHAPERHSCRPSVDVLFESVAREKGAGALCCLLTGMGKDGALGMLAIKRAGGLTFAQDEATSTVYGMPREAAQLGAADHILALPQFAPTLRRLAGTGS